MSGIDGVLLPIELPIREVRFDELLVLPELAAGCFVAVGAEDVLPSLEEAGRVVFCFSAAGTDGVLAPIEPPMREVLPEELPGLPELTAVSERPAPRLLRDVPLAVSGLAAGCFASVEEGGSDLPMTLPIRERDSVVLCLEIDDDGLRLVSMLFRRELKLERDEFEFVTVSREADGEDCVLAVVIDCRCVVIELPMRDDIEELILPFELVVDRLLTFDLLELVVVELLPKILPMLRLLFEVLWFCLELVEGMVIEFDRSELELDCVLGVVIELPMRDDIEELILPFELVVDRLLTLDLEFVVVELLPKRLPMLMLRFDLLADDEELEGSLPMLTLPDGLDGVLRFVIILLELFLDVMADELRLGIVTLERFVVGARLVMLLDEMLRLGDEMLGLEDLTDTELLLTLLRLLVFVREGADLAAGALLEELLDFAFFLAEKAGSARKISAQASITSAIAGFLRFFRANMICLLSSIKPQKRPRSFTTLHKKGTNSLKSNEKSTKHIFFRLIYVSLKC